MKYQGSKRTISKKIIPIILNRCNQDIIFYDVCCGGGNLISEIPLKTRIAIDIDEYVIEAMKIIRDNPKLLPKNNKEFTENDYKDIQLNKDKYPKWLVGYVGYALSWGGKWFGGYCRSNNTARDYINESYRNALNQSVKIQNVKFICASYDEINYSKNSIIYTDPPYENTTKYKKKFNHKEFWDWVRDMSNNEYRIYVSEYNAPKDFSCIYEKQQHIPLSNLTGKEQNKYKKEKLFVYKKNIRSKLF